MPAVLFVTLNVVDAYLTKMALTAGAIEANPLMTIIGSDMLTKGLIAILLAFVLYSFGKERTLWPVNFILFGVVLWNSATWLIVNV
jgi:hypothetical protein